MSQVANNHLDLIRKGLHWKNRNRVESTSSSSIDVPNKESRSDTSEVRESSFAIPIKPNFFTEIKEFGTGVSISTPSPTPTK